MVLRLFLFFIFFANIVYSNELKTITPEEFLNENPSPERKAIVDFIVHQFDGRSVSQVELDRLWNNERVRKSQGLIRFQIVDQKLYVDSFDLKCIYCLDLWQYFQDFIQRYRVNDIDFIVYARDEVFTEKHMDSLIRDIPAFMMSKNLDSDYEKNKLLFPDAYLLKKRWEIVSSFMEDEGKNHSWNSKINKVFWRGSSTGWDRNKLYIRNNYNIQNFDKFPRISLVMLSKLYPDLINARFAHYPQLSDDKSGNDFKKIFTLLFSEPDSANLKEHLLYKYLIAVDGNTCTWERLPWIMLSQSVLVKQETANIEWFYPALKPYVHYIPIKEDLSNLLEQIEWMKGHDSELEIISQNSYNFAKNNLMPEQIDQQMAIVLNEYSKLHHGEKIKVTLTPADEAVSFFALINLLIDKMMHRWLN